MVLERRVIDLKLVLRLTTSSIKAKRTRESANGVKDLAAEKKKSYYLPRVRCILLFDSRRKWANDLDPRCQAPGRKTSTRNGKDHSSARKRPHP